MSDLQPVIHEQQIPGIFTSVVEVHRALEEQGLDRTLHHLVQLRASQINRCGYCVAMHIKEARRDGETNERLDRVVVWDQVSDFSEREKAALAWTDALTALDPKIDLGLMRAQLRKHFTEKEISLLTAAIGVINFWNRINVSKH